MRTNIFISWFETQGNVEYILKNKIGLNRIAIPSVTFMELCIGMSTKNELVLLQKRLRGYPVIHFNHKVSALAIDLLNKFNLSHNLQIPDAIIAATAVVSKLKLFTLI